MRYHGHAQRGADGNWFPKVVNEDSFDLETQIQSAAKYFEDSSMGKTLR